MMKRTLNSWLLLAACAGWPALNHAATPTQDNSMLSDTQMSHADGQTVFEHICQGCHMPDGKGAIGAGAYPALAGDPRLVSAQYMAAVVLFGRHDMPAFGPRAGDGDDSGEGGLSDAQIAAVINYVRSHFGNHWPDRLQASDIAAMHATPRQP